MFGGQSRKWRIRHTDYLLIYRLVDDGVEARALLRANVEALGVAGTSRIFRRDATKLGAVTLEPFDLVFLDPPYGRGLGDEALAGLVSGGWLAPGALVAADDITHDTMADYLAYVREPAHGYVSVAFAVADGVELSSWAGAATAP